MKFREFFLVAAEESANQYASRLIEVFQKDLNLQDVRFSGIGFSKLKEKNFHHVFNAQELSVMGILEVLRKWKTIRKAFVISVDYILKNKPNAVILIDFGGFNLRLAAEIKKKSPETKILYFISPKLWAWGSKRALKVKAFIDEMYVIHPFEVEFYKKWGVRARFVGHPLLQELRSNFSDLFWVNREKEKEGFLKNQRILGVMLGSRPSEISRHKEPFCKTIRFLKEKNKDLKIAFIIPPSKTKDFFKKELKDLNVEYKILQSDDPMEKIALCDLCLVASGTATLQVGLLGIPMAIGYIMNPITMFFAKTFVKDVKYAGLVNIIKDQEISKEFLQGDFKPKVVAAYLNDLLSNKEFYEDTKKELLTLKKELGTQNVYERLKDELLKFL